MNTATTSNINNNNELDKKSNQLKIKTAREKLKLYYGLNNNSTPNSSSSDTKSTTNNKLSNFDQYLGQGIDETDFQPDQYLAPIYKSCPINTLLQLNNQWVTEAKQLQGDKNNLIYENYSKFLSATEAIGEVRSSISDLLPSLTGLTSSLATVTNTVNELHSSFQPERQKLSQQYSTHQILKKSEFLLNLPKQLNYLLQVKNYKKLIEQFQFTKELLKRYEHMNIFDTISKDCQAIMNQVYTDLKDSLKDSKNSIADTSKSLNLLMAIDPSEYEEWFQYYIDFCQKFFDQSNQHHQDEYKQFIGSDDNESFDLEKAQILFDKIDKSCLQVLSDVTKYGHYLFFPKGGFTHKEYLVTPIPDQNISRLTFEFNRFVINLYDSVYNELIEKIISIQRSSKETNGTVVCFSVHLNNLIQYEELSGKDNSCVDLLSKLRTNIYDWFKSYIDELFSQIHLHSKEKFREIWNTKSLNIDLSDFSNIQNFDNFNLQSCLLVAENWLLNQLMTKVLPKLQELQSSNHEFWRISSTNVLFLNYLQSTLKQFWFDWIFNTLNEIINEREEENINLILLMCKLLSDCHVNLIETIYLSFIQTLIQDHPLFNQSSNEPGPTEEESMSGWMLQCRDITTTCQLQSKKMLNQFIIQFGMKIVKELESYYNGRLDETYSIDQFDPIYLQILIKLHLLEREVSLVFGFVKEGDLNWELGIDNMASDSKRGSFNRSSFQSGIGIGSPSYRNSIGYSQSPILPNAPIGSSDNTQQHWLARINRLFYERIEFYPTITNFNLESILNNIMNIILKGFSELIRFQQFNEIQFTKLQLNLVNWKKNLPKLIINNNNFNYLIDEVMSSAFKRTLNSSYLESTQTDSLLNVIYTKDAYWNQINQQFNLMPISLSNNYLNLPNTSIIHEED